MLAICVWFCSCLCNQVCSRVSGALLLTSRTLSLSFLTNNSSSDSKAFLHFIAFSGSPTAVHRAFLFFDAKAWPQSQTDLFTCTTVLHCGHTLLRHVHPLHSVGEVFCGAPMYADDLALVASSPEELQAMLDIVSHYASQWRYRLNSSKSVILVLGESPRSRALARSNRQWLLAG